MAAVGAWANLKDPGEDGAQGDAAQRPAYTPPQPPPPQPRPEGKKMGSSLNSLPSTPEERRKAMLASHGQK